MTIATQATGKQWIVASESTPDTLYVVKRVDGQYTCSCLGFYHHGHCKHATKIAAREAQPYTSKLSPEAREWGLAQLSSKRA